MDYSKQRHKELGDFLRTRRARIAPSQVGLPEGIRRRTPGLRREEVALLAGIGLTWYTWLEQGRSIQVSEAVLDSLSRVLLLDEQEMAYLYTLAQKAPPAALTKQAPSLNPMVQHVMDNLRFCPATVLDGKWNIIAWNQAAALVFLDFSQLAPAKRNLLEITFTNEAYKKLFADWESKARGMIARFRLACGKHIEEPWFVDFIRALRENSREFSLWWPIHNVENEQEVVKTICHPALGELIFEHTSYLVADNAELKMYVNTPLVGTDTEAKIRSLVDRAK
ncbi:helix-turn-helix domain-containing protein|uniref:helix-turn-helix transcriptional regulator n=3 Tax=Dendrosporobacter quercicolus TaxID=146817 RepID=UPI00156D81E5|nr:helix-turn-helix transcriptional regulator [Dendrosporobacter quercicolus]NSL50116.1 helix-turn-helix domain-containing protein [Dendrosporobacter quercicolus DSM 1736]